MDWMKLTVLTTTIASDIVSQTLIDAGSAGTVIEDKNDVKLNQRPEGQWDIIDEEIARRIGDDVKVTGFYPLDERASDTAAHVREKLSKLSELAPGVELGKLTVTMSTIDDEDWAENWKKSYKPFRLGKHIVIRPGWEEYSPEPDDQDHHHRSRHGVRYRNARDHRHVRFAGGGNREAGHDGDRRGHRHRHSGHCRRAHGREARAGQRH